MRILMLLITVLLPPAILAMPCSETPESEKALEAEMEEIKNLDAEGEKEFKAALDRFQVVSKKDDKQIIAYGAQIVNKPEIAQLQEDRQALGLKMLSLLSGTDCNALRENVKKIKSVIALQWVSVVTAIQADAQTFLAQDMGKAPDIRATTETGKKVILHANGTWSEDPRK